MTVPRFSTGLFLAGVLSLAFAVHAAAPADMALGSPKAPVTVIEYASIGCPHCGTWARDVFPEFKRRFIDTGRVRFVLREMLTGDADVAAAGFLTARCAGPEKYFQVVEGLFEAQPKMAEDGDDLPSLLQVAGQAGLSKVQVSDCLADHAALSALEARSDGYARDDHVDGTPTFDINGTRMVGEQSLAALTTAIDAAAHRRR
ncbi:MAG: DsbA family protein [Caulobacteraceae bacterium]